MFLAGDNDPYNLLLNEGVLKPIYGFSLLGDYNGTKEICPSSQLTTGTFLKSHFITTGVAKMSEGATIARPSHGPKDFRILGLATDGNPCILVSTSGPRVVVDTGFTKMWPGYWNNEGVGRYITNAICWLAGFQLGNENYSLD